MFTHKRCTKKKKLKLLRNDGRKSDIFLFFFNFMKFLIPLLKEDETR